MNNWSPTSPLFARPSSLSSDETPWPDYDGWTIAELLRGERFAPPPTAAEQRPVPMPSVGARAGPVTAAMQPAWLANGQWQAMPGRPPKLPTDAPWPDYEGWSIPELMVGRRFARAMPTAPPEPTSTGTDWLAGAQWRATPATGPWPEPPPFLNAPPQDYPSHLGPVPRAPDWEQVVTGPSPWSPLAKPPRATDWGRTTAAIDEVAEAEDARLAAAMRTGQWRRRNQRPYEGYTAPRLTQPTDDSDLGERARLNLLDSYYRGSLFGAARLALMKMLNDLPDGSISPATNRVRDELRKEYQQILADLRRYDRMPGFQNPSEFGTAALGRLGGAALSPEGLASLGTLRQVGGMFVNASRTALKNGILFGAVDPAVQGLNIAAGVQDEYSPLRTLTAAGVAATFGGGAQLGTEVLGKLAARWLPSFTDAVRGGSVEVRVFRVEGKPNLRIDVFETGDVIVRDNTNALFLNFGSRPRAEEFLARRIAQGMKDPVIKSFMSRVVSWMTSGQRP
jgi:hypothetical protein